MTWDRLNRRDFLASAAALTAGLSLGVGRANAAPAPLRILILGGTGFIGPHQVRAAQERGHTLTLFNRGRTNPGMFPNIETLLGDRNGDLKALEGRTWDCVIDNSGFEPAQLELSGKLLKSAVKQYVFVSTQSVYSSRSIIDQDETGAVGRAGVEEQEWSGYGPLKARCEKALLAEMPNTTTILRPAVIVGPGDSSDRFTYWVARMDRGGDVLGPGLPDDPTQYIDVRDLCEWTIRLLEAKTFGTFNVTGPLAPLTVKAFLEGIQKATQKPANIVWTNHQFLAEQRVRPFSDLPLWMVPAGETAGFLRMSAKRAQAAGLTYRPLTVSAADTLAWWKSEPAERRNANMRAGLPAERETAVLAAWKARSTGTE